MTASALSIGNPLSLKELTRRESGLRLRYIELPDHGSTYPPSGDEEARGILVQSLGLLELTLISACAMEAANHLALTTGAELANHMDALLSHTRAMSGLDPIEIIREHAPGQGQGSLADELPPFGRVIYTMKAIIAACPIEDLERLAERLSERPVGHRCRLAYNRLRAFVRRNDPKAHQRIRALGDAYAQGAVGIRQASEILGLSVPDVVAAFEELGYARNVETIRLNATHRQDVLATLRADRLSRKGKVVQDPSRAARHAIASERIELVDARPWIQD